MRPPPAITFLLSLAALPVAFLWVWRQERHILRAGKPLSPNSINDARAVGVRCPERVRLLVVDGVPGTTGRLMRELESRTGICTSDAAALTARYGIFLTPSLAEDRETIAHELVHTAQYERMGGIAPFLWNYLHGCLDEGYFDCRMEVEARVLAAQVTLPRNDPSTSIA